MIPVELQAHGLVLSLPTEHDVDDITEACQDPLIQRFTPVGTPYRRDRAQSFVRELVAPGWAKNTDYVWAIRSARGQRLNGMIGVHDVADGSAELGYWVAPWARRQGLATRAVGLVAQWAFTGGQLARLEWRAITANEASRKVALACGFRIEGEVRGLISVQGQRFDGWIGTLYPHDMTTR